MTKKEIHNIFKDFIVTVRGQKAIIFLGYKNTKGEDGFLPYTEEREKEVVKICKSHDLKYNIISKTEYKRIAVRLYIEL